jgi:hypothetical protein
MLTRIFCANNSMAVANASQNHLSGGQSWYGGFVEDISITVMSQIISKQINQSRATADCCCVFAGCIFHTQPSASAHAAHAVAYVYHTVHIITVRVSIPLQASSIAS